MVMNVKALRHHGSVITPPPPVESPSPVPAVLVRFYLDGVVATDTVAIGAETFAYPDGPFQFFILTSSGGNPPILDWIFNSDNGDLFATISADTVDLGGGLTTVARIKLAFGLHGAEGALTSIYNGTTFEAQAYEHDPIFPFSRAYGPLLSFSCQPTLHDPFFQTGTWYVNRYSRNGGFHQIDSLAVQNLTYPANWDSAEKVVQGNMILLMPNSITWGTLSRLSWQITQLAGTTRKMAVFGFPYTFSYGSVPAGMDGALIGIDPAISGSAFEFNPKLFAINDLVGLDTPNGWASGWFTADSYSAPHPYQSFAFFERLERGFSYAGTSYEIQAKFGMADFGDPIILTCEV
jgi:hypothetical protein